MVSVVVTPTQLYAGQAGVQTILVAVAGISIPWMLVSKPLILYMRQPAAAHDEEHGASRDKCVLMSDVNAVGECKSDSW